MMLAGGEPMAERSQLNVRIDKATSDRLNALARRLSLSQGAVVRLAVARMAQGEGIEIEASDPEPTGKAAA
jgi:antitoxin component of RelBE/YafQ-DinJ toxin-antitoxin module